MTISRKKWGKSTTKTEKIIREAIPKDDTMKEIDEYLGKVRSVTSYDLVKRFNIRMSIARKILRDKEESGEIVPYIRESGFVAYTMPSEMEEKDGSQRIMIADVLEEVASSVEGPVIITDEMDTALAEASVAIGSVKPSRLARQRRELGEKKERKDTRPEVVIEPIPAQPEPVAEVIEETPKEAPAKKPSKKPAKKPTKKAPAKKKPAKKTTKKKADEEKPKKAPAKKTTKKKAEEKPKKTPAKKTTTKKKATEKKPKKPAAKKTTAKKTTKKKAAEEKPKKTTKKKETATKKKPAAKVSTTKKTTTKKKATKGKSQKKTTKKS
jgi:ribosomal protein S25